MHFFQTFILGIVQGLGEFLPISSTAHLIMVPWIMGWKEQSLAVDVALHFGTLIALLAYFWRDWYNLIISNINKSKDPATGESFLLWPIIIACIPGAVAGILLEKKADTAFHNPVLIASTLIVMGLVLFAADRLGKKNRPINKVGIADWLIIGCAQALAIIPGVSRSGITITAGLFCGLNREAAARFSFLLSAPIIFGAAVFESRKLIHANLSSHDWMALGIGIVSAGIVGYLCIGFLIKLLQKRTLDIFVVYRIVIGIALLVANGMGLLHL